MATTERKLRVGIIGTGGIATGAHIPGYQKTDGVEIYAACDVIKERAEQMAERFGIPHVFTDYEKMLGDPELDVVSICTPPFVHKEPTIAALQAGKHVLCEKPMALDAQEAQEMVDAWHHSRQTHNNKFSIGFHSRWGYKAQVLKRAIDEGALGDIYYGRAVALRRRGVPAWGVFTSKAKNGGGPLIDIGVHALDLALWLMGHPQPASVYGVAFRKFGNRAGVFNPWGAWDHKTYDVEDSAFAMIRFQNGAALQLECSWVLNIEKSMSQTILAGTEGGAQMEPFKIIQEKFGTLLDAAPPETPAEGQNRLEEKPHTLQIQGFIRAVREDRNPLVLPEQALMVSRIVDAIYQSTETGDAVKL
ncbi:MAG TPA: Gfo/Idh/MocA family oxidoreductase [Chloroflexota bacterium]|nr:Gfo/Idh/MocA family oxidoreductase [Chloroflexota bacterium]